MIIAINYKLRDSLFSDIELNTTSLFSCYLLKSRLWKENKCSPIMAVIWWFIPILNLWKPYTIARDIWKASASYAGIHNCIEWKELPSSNTIKLWWILGLLSVLLTVVNVAYTNFNYSDREPVGQDLVWLNKVTYYSNFIVISINILSITSTLFFIRMIKRVSMWQEKLALNPKVKNWVLFSKWNRSGNRFWLNCPQGSISYYDRSNLISLIPCFNVIRGIYSRIKFKVQI